jgi:hypothetical protein
MPPLTPTPKQRKITPRSAEPALRVRVRKVLDDRAGERWDRVMEILIEAGRRHPEGTPR